MHGGKVTLAFVYIKELRNISAGHFIKHKPPISEEWYDALNYIFNSANDEWIHIKI